MFGVKSKNNQKMLAVLAIAMAALMFNNCGRPSKLPDGEGVFSSNSGVVGFDVLSSKIFQPKCLACHTQFGTYSELMNSGFITGKTPEASKLYLMVSSGQMPKNGTPLAEGEVRAIYDWISNGTPEFSTAGTSGGNPVSGTPGTGAPSTGTGTTSVGSGSIGISPTFAWIQANVLTPRCVICHRGASAPAGYDLSSYDAVMMGGRVMAGNPTASVFFQRINNNSMPPGGPALSAEVKAAISQWIANGAMNDAPVGGVVGGGQAPPPLPPLEPKFSSIMANIIGPRCLACHSSVSPRAGVVLQDYNSVRRYVTARDAGDSDLYKVIEDNEMPQSGGPLSFEQKETIRQWINAGALNN